MQVGVPRGRWWGRLPAPAGLNLPRRYGRADSPFGHRRWDFRPHRRDRASRPPRSAGSASPAPPRCAPGPSGARGASRAAARPSARSVLPRPSASIGVREPPVRRPAGRRPRLNRFGTALAMAPPPGPGTLSRPRPPPRLMFSGPGSGGAAEPPGRARSGCGTASPDRSRAPQRPHLGDGQRGVLSPAVAAAFGLTRASAASEPPRGWCRLGSLSGRQGLRRGVMVEGGLELRRRTAFLSRRETGRRWTRFGWVNLPGG